MDRLVGQAALVTGAGGGIGAAVTRRLAAEGAFVGAADIELRRVEELAREVRGLALEVDVTSAHSVRAGLEAFLGHAGRIDILVNCAGIVDSTPLDEEVEPSQWRRVFDVNVLGTFLPSQAVLPHLHEGGSIINLGSRAGMTGSTASGVAYAASKAAVINLTKSFAKHAARRGIRVNVINAGVIDTPLVQEFSAEWQERFKQQNLLGRIGRPEEVAAAVVFLASSDSSLMTGAELNLTGGGCI